MNSSHTYVHVGPHFGTVPVPALVIQFWNWNTQVPKSALCQNGVPSAGTGRPTAGTGLDLILPFTLFQNWLPSSKTGHPVPEPGFIPETPKRHSSHLGTSSKTGCPNVGTHASKSSRGLVRPKNTY